MQLAGTVANTLETTAAQQPQRTEPRPEPLSCVARPKLMLASLLTADLVALSLAMIGAVYLRWVLGGTYYPHMYFQFWPVVVVFLAAYAAMRLYPGVPHVPAEELRRLTVVTTLGFLGLGAATFLFKEGEALSRGVLLLAWAGAVVGVPLARAVVRSLCAHRAWWGKPVMILGCNDTAHQLISLLKSQPRIGLRPVGVAGEPADGAKAIAGVPIIGGLRQARQIARQRGIGYAILTEAHLPPERLRRLLEKLSHRFDHLMLIPELSGFSSLWVSAVDLQGTVALEVRHRLLDPGRQVLKRVVDLTIITLAAPLVLPLVALLALAVRIDSPGPVFFSQPRIGAGGRRFRMWKFRSMVRDADAVLARALAEDPQLRAEWQAAQKLRHDPRITRVGRLLRKTSLDELPQLWNVLTGDMSLVGPRPIVDEEIPRYRDRYTLYKKVRPGLTGLWQVSGRNRLTYDQRVRLDTYYVRNWSVWLDIYLLMRTVWTVLRCHGAY